MKFALKFEVGDGIASFEIANALRDTADAIEFTFRPYITYPSGPQSVCSGNVKGKWEVTEQKDEPTNQKSGICETHKTDLTTCPCSMLPPADESNLRERFKKFSEALGDR